MAYTTIDKPSDYFNTVLYTGNSSTQSISGVNFRPDLVWIKGRNSAQPHVLQDVVRGKSGSNYYYLVSNDTAAEDVQVDNDGVQSLDTDGFSVNYTNGGAWNFSGTTYAAWNWLAGGTAVSNTQGTINSSVSANTTAGISLISYTGTGSAGSVGHGLNQAPEMVIYKNRTTAGRNWNVYHQYMNPADPGAAHMNLNLTDGKGFASSVFNDAETTATTIPVGTSTDNNASGNSIIAYAFHSVKGFSKFGSYTGNGSADGPFIYTGFKPAWILLKQSSTSGAGWRMHDNKRGISGNPEDETLYASASNAESTGRDVDFLSNGFKLRTTAGDGNASGETYIYMAFAESPFTTSTGIPTTAR